MTDYPLPLARPRRLAIARPAGALALLVAVSALVRLLAVTGRAAQRYFPDEYMYGQLARSLADGHGYAVLGERSTFPSPVQPLLTSLAWLPGDPELAFRLTQGINAVAMSLAAIPVYLLCRRLGLSLRTSLLAAAAAVAAPDLLYTGYVTADAIGYLLALVAVERGVRALSSPGPGASTAFLVAAALATLDRIQYALLLVAAIPAALAVERRLGRAVRRHALVLVAGALLVAAGAALTQVGPYATVATFRPDLGTAEWVPRTLWGLALACGATVVPGALTWLACELRAPTSPARAAFAGLTASLVGLLAAAAAAMADQTGSERFFERYLMLLLPLVVVAFACWAAAGARALRASVALALGLTVVAAVSPVSSLAAGQGRADSPFLLAVGRLEEAVGVGSASLVVALAATGAAWLGVGLGRRGAAPVLLLTIVLFAGVSSAAHEADRKLSAGLLARAVPDPAWVDSVADGPVVLVHGPGSDPAASMALALRNRTVRAGVVLGERATPFVGFGLRARLDATGRLLIGGQPVTRAAVFDDPRTRVLAEPGLSVAGPAGALLVRPAPEVRVEATVEGLADDGRLASRAAVTLYPSGAPGSCRSLTLAVTAPSSGPTTVVAGASRLQVPAGATRRLVVATGAPARRVVVVSSPVVETLGGGRQVTANATAAVSDTPCAERRNG